MNPKQFLFFLILIFLIEGCVPLSKLDKLLTLKAYSKNKDAQQAYCEFQTKNFEKLLDVVKEGNINQYPDKKSFYKAFGAPIFVKELTQGGQFVEKWLYRHSTKAFNSEKIYLYFDQTGKLIDWMHILPTKTDNKT